MTLDIPFGTIDWTEVPATVHDGEAGTATWQTVQTGSVRLRLVTYPGRAASFLTAFSPISAGFRGVSAAPSNSAALRVISEGGSSR